MSPHFIPDGYLPTRQVIELRAELAFGDEWRAANIKKKKPINQGDKIKYEEEKKAIIEEEQIKDRLKSEMRHKIIHELQADLHNGKLDAFLLRMDGEISKFSRQYWGNFRNGFLTLQSGTVGVRPVEGTVLFGEDAIQAWLHPSSDTPPGEANAGQRGRGNEGSAAGAAEEQAPKQSIQEFMFSHAEHHLCGADATYRAARARGYEVSRDFVRQFFRENKDRLPAGCSDAGLRRP